MEQFRESVLESVRTMQALSREMADRTFATIEEIESRFTRFNDRLITLERVCFDEPAATRRRTGAAPEAEGVARRLPAAPEAEGGSLAAAAPEAEGVARRLPAAPEAEGGGLSDMLQRVLNAMPAAVAVEVARLRHIATPAAPEAEGAARRLPAAPEAEGGSLGHSLEGAINGDRLD